MPCDGHQRALAFLVSGQYSFTHLPVHLAVARMSIFSRRLGIALVLTLVSTLVLAALCLGTRTAHAQAAPVTYWIPSWPIGFGGDLTIDPGSNTYGNFPSFDRGSARGGGFSHMRYNFPNGWFVGTEGGAMGLSMSGINQGGAFGIPLALFRRRAVRL